MISAKKRNGYGYSTIEIPNQKLFHIVPYTPTTLYHLEFKSSQYRLVSQRQNQSNAGKKNSNTLYTNDK